MENFFNCFIFLIFGLHAEKCGDYLEENFDPIWSFIEEKRSHQPVPNYIKYVLSYCGYNNGITIASIDDDDIDYCVQEVRNGSITSYQSKIGNKGVLPACRKTSESFEFLPRNLKYLMDIVEMLKSYIKENGIDCFNLKPEKPSKKTGHKKAPNKSLISRIR